MTASAPSARVQLAIGDVTTTVTSGDPQLSLTMPRAVARFATDQADSDIRVDARWAVASLRPAGRLIFDSGGLWQLHEADGQLTWRFTSPKFGTLPYKTAAFAPDFSSGTVSLHPPYFAASVPVYPLEYPLDELLITNWLALGRGVEMHACGVRDAGGAGYLFAGHSGAGKSTMARLWRRQPGVTVLSDDRIILRAIDDQIWMYGTPWHGDEPLASPTRTRLTEGFFLQHAPDNAVALVNGARTVADLMARSFPPFASASGLEFVMSFLETTIRQVPFFTLGFKPDSAVLRVIRSAI